MKQIDWEKGLKDLKEAMKNAPEKTRKDLKKIMDNQAKINNRMKNLRLD